jgi:NAD(P)-dependent dehydrogenase (short-subunit alcohol dehydrogenase family)
MGELKRLQNKRPRLSTSIDPVHYQFIRDMAERHNRDQSVVVDQLLMDGRRYWDLSEKQKKELGRELGALREAQKESKALLLQLSRWLAMLLAQQNLAAATVYPDGPETTPPASFAEWETSIREIASEIKENG